jgi:hypothetical protein
MHVNGNVWAERAEPPLDVSCLLTRKLCVITVGVKVGSERALEVRISIWVICSVLAIRQPWTGLVRLQRGRTMISNFSRKPAAHVGSASIAPRSARVASSPAGSFPCTEPWSQMRTLLVELEERARRTYGKNFPSSLKKSALLYEAQAAFFCAKL